MDTFYADPNRGLKNFQISTNGTLQTTAGSNKSKSKMRFEKFKLSVFLTNLLSIVAINAAEKTYSKKN